MVPVSKKVLRTQTFTPPQKGFELRPPLPGSLCSESGSVSPAPGLKYLVWAHGLVSASARGAKALETAGGSARSPRSGAQVRGRLGVRAGRRSAGGARDGPRFG